MDGFQTGVIALIKSALTGEKADIPENFDWDNVLKISKKHNIVPIIYYGIKNSDIKLSPEMEEKFSQIVLLGIMIDNNQEYEIRELRKIFTAKKIDFAPLKGIRLKKYFPKSEMRSMSDLDILFRTDQIDEVNHLMINREYIFKTETDHVIELSKNRFINLELHKKLIPQTEAFGSYYKDCWQLFYPMENGSNEYIMNPSDEYIFLFLHFTKHYISGGVGIRQLLDLWVFSEKEKIDYTYVKIQLSSLNLDVFWGNVHRTLSSWFGYEKADEKTDFITEFIFSSGVFGNHKDYLISTAVKAHENPDSAGKRKIFHLFFLPYSGMCVKYPILKNHPVLLPLYWVIRWLNAIIFKKKKGIMHLKEFSKISGSDIRTAIKEFNYVGLDFNFKE